VSVNGSFGGNLEFKNLAKTFHFESRNTDLRVERLPGRITMDLAALTGVNMVGADHDHDQIEGREARGFHAVAEGWNWSAAIWSCVRTVCRWRRSTRAAECRQYRLDPAAGASFDLVASTERA
jgi:hypothetical protein